jgi:hypothetical protein
MTCLESNKQHIMVWHVSCVFSPGKTWCSPIHSVQFRKIDRHGSWSGSARRPRILTAPRTQVRINMVISMHPMSMCRSTHSFQINFNQCTLRKIDKNAKWIKRHRKWAKENKAHLLMTVSWIRSEALPSDSPSTGECYRIPWRLCKAMAAGCRGGNHLQGDGGGWVPGYVVGTFW